jgi:hypothetical protein
MTQVSFSSLLSPVMMPILLWGKARAGRSTRAGKLILKTAGVPEIDLITLEYLIRGRLRRSVAVMTILFGPW